MPCYDPRDSSEYVREEESKKREKIEAMLCAVMSCIERYNAGYIFTNHDWNESGITKEELYAWWDRHVEKDLARIAKEKKKYAIGRLTQEITNTPDSQVKDMMEIVDEALSAWNRKKK